VRFAHSWLVNKIIALSVTVSPLAIYGQAQGVATQAAFP